ncbi:hypothetical protein AB0395_33105 [Streptosporangium sp. NPDC051023]|uniref:hypothetical protein n=1 Tax=Streptosporangium sp. NPDC051023 TaxID=3155410 RepID=UPI00344D4D5D
MADLPSAICIYGALVVDLAPWTVAQARALDLSPRPLFTAAVIGCVLLWPLTMLLAINLIRRRCGW